MTTQSKQHATDLFVDVTPSFVGICGSDLQKIDTSSTDTAFKAIGHEIVAEYQDGLVVINPLIVCGECRNCKAGKTVFCSQLLALGRNHKGGFGGSVSVPARNIHPVKLQNPSVGVLADPYAVVLHGLKQVTPAPRIAILGDGILAQLSLLFYALHPNGCHEICIVAKDNNRAKELEQAYQERFKETPISIRFVSSEGASESDSSFELIVEAVGRAQSDTLNRAIAMVAPRGKIVSFGVYRVGYKADLDIRTLLYKEAKLVGSNSFEPADFNDAISELQSEEKSFIALMGASYDSREWKLAFDDALSKSTGLPQKVTISFAGKSGSEERLTKDKENEYVMGK